MIKMVSIIMRNAIP